MGLSVGGRCYGTAVQAAQAECSSYPRTYASADGVVTYSCAGVSTDGGQLSITHTDTAGASSSASVAVGFAPCDEMQTYNDSLEVWRLSLATLTAVWCAKTFLLKFFSNV